MTTRVTKTPARFAIVFVLALLSSACQTPLRTTPIDELLVSASSFDGRTVKVSGQVTNVVKLPFVEMRLFTVRDTTGEIAVLTYEELPTLNSTATVSGVFSTVAFAGASAVGPHITIGTPEPVGPGRGSGVLNR